MKYLITLLLVVTLFGCNVTQTLERTYSQTLVVDAMLNQGYDVEDEIIKGLSDEDAYRVLEAFQKYENFKNKWVENVNLNLILTEGFMVDYSLITSEYLKVRTIVVKNWDTYPEEVKIHLRSVDKGYNVVHQGLLRAFAKGEKYEVYYEAAKAVVLLSQLFIGV